MKRCLIVILSLISLCSFTQTYLVDQHFSNVAPAGWSSTSNVWNFARNESATGNYRNVYDATTYSARFSTAANGNTIYIYIPINFKDGYTYTLTFYTKRACSVVINTNELPNQTTLLTTETQTNASCNSNWNNWYQWSVTIPSTYTGVGYFQIWVKTIYGGPTSVYLDDVTILESPPTSLPIELLYFKGEGKDIGNILNWSTASELNNESFHIYNSTNGTIWNLLTSIPGAGTKSTQTDYTYTDTDVNTTITYYVLKQTDTDKKTKLFEPISVYNKRTYKTVLRCTDLLGRVLETSSGQARIVEYTDGSKAFVIGNAF